MSAGIWRHARLFGDDGRAAASAAAEGWSLGEGDTPLQPWPELAEALGLAALGLKREDQNPGHSHKDRGLLYQVAYHHAAAGGPSTFVISSSGNAAVSAAAACGVTGDHLLAFVAPDTAQAKRARLERSGATVIASKRPLNFARYAARVFGLVNLRGTADPIATVGYRSIAAELIEQDPALDAVVTFASSGTSARGLLEGFAALQRPVAVWAVQAGVCLGIARALRPDLADEPSNPAGRLGIRTPPDAAALAGALVASSGGAIVVRAPALDAAADRMEARGLRTSAEGAAVVAALIERAKAFAGQRLAVVVTGDAAQWSRHHAPEGGVTEGDLVASYTELRGLLIARGLSPA